jgi:prephenate dehydrogenase
MSSPVYEHLALIGCGLMGGSFALAAKQAGLVKSVGGYSRSIGSARRALELGIVDSVAETAEECVQGADLVLLAVPVGATQATLQSLLPSLATHALVMDVGSTKQDVTQAARAALGERIAQFMPAHPICGKEVAGIEHASTSLYKGQQVILDGNHPLAGKTLHISAQVLEVRAASAEEIAHGHVHGAHGHQH